MVTIWRHMHGPWPDTRHVLFAFHLRLAAVRLFLQKKWDPKKIICFPVTSLELCSLHKYKTLGRLDEARTLNSSHLFEGITLAAKKCCKSSMSRVPCHLPSLSSPQPVQLVAIARATGRAPPRFTEGRQSAASSPALHLCDSTEVSPLT